ncbi:MAG: tail fiber domain-containing protein [Chitinophagaceae bacterium]
MAVLINQAKKIVELGWCKRRIENISPTFCSAGVWTGSDRNLKNDIRPLTGALAIIDQLKASVYTFKTSEYKKMHLPEGLQYGLIADELEQILPTAVKKAVQPPTYERNDEKNGKK